MELDEVVRRFGALCALTQPEAEAERELCAAALARVEEERNGLPGGEAPLADYAAALAGHRFVLRCLARGITVAIGDPRSGPAGARSAAEALEEDCRLAAARWLRPAGFCFRQVPCPPEDAPEDGSEENAGTGSAPGDGGEGNTGTESAPGSGGEENDGAGSAPGNGSEENAGTGSVPGSGGNEYAGTGPAQGPEGGKEAVP